MAQLIQLRSLHGETPVLSNSVDILDRDFRFKLSDTDELYSSDIDGILPPTGSTPIYTAVKNLRCYVPSSPAIYIGQVNLFFANLASDWDGVEIYVTQSSSYVNPIAQGNTPLAGFTHNINNYTPNSLGFTPLMITNGSIVAPNTGFFGNYIQMQMKVTRYARAGIAPPIRLRLGYSEWL